MKKKRILLIAPLAILGIVIFAWIGGELVMHLWNWLLPSLFGWKLITFWQAIGLLALCRILFGGLGLRGGHHSRHKMWHRCEHMTPEEREKLRHGLHEKWGGAPPDSKPTA